MVTLRTKNLSRTALGVGALGLALLPVASYAATASTSNIQISAAIGSAISINTPTAVAVSLTPTAAGPVSMGSHTVTVSTNNSTGYKLYLKDADASLNLVSGANNITPTAGTAAAPAALTVMNTFGYAVAGAPFAGTYTTGDNQVYDGTKTFAGITASDVQIRNTATTATNENTSVYWGVRADTSLPNGTYVDNVIYSAITN